MNSCVGHFGYIEVCCLHGADICCQTRTQPSRTLAVGQVSLSDVSIAVLCHRCVTNWYYSIVIDQFLCCLDLYTRVEACHYCLSQIVVLLTGDHKLFSTHTSTSSSVEFLKYSINFEIGSRQNSHDVHGIQIKVAPGCRLTMNIWLACWLIRKRSDGEMAVWLSRPRLYNHIVASNIFLTVIEPLSVVS